MMNPEIHSRGAFFWSRKEEVYFSLVKAPVFQQLSRQSTKVSSIAQKRNFQSSTVWLGLLEK
jgi:hypothetical protein